MNVDGLWNLTQLRLDRCNAQRCEEDVGDFPSARASTYVDEATKCTLPMLAIQTLNFTLRVSASRKNHSGFCTARPTSTIGGRRC